MRVRFAERERILHHDKSTGVSLDHGTKRGVEVERTSNLNGFNLDREQVCGLLRLLEHNRGVGVCCVPDDRHTRKSRNQFLE